MLRLCRLIAACMVYLISLTMISVQQTSGITENIISDDKGFPIVSKEGKVADLF